MKRILAMAGLVLVNACSDGVTSGDSSDAITTTRDPHAGVFAEWYSGAPPNLPYVVGQQTVFQWADLVKSDGTPDFSALDTALANAPLATTLQINGGRKPAWIYKHVPYAFLSDPSNASSCPSSTWSDNEAGDQINGCTVTPMYWHPAFINAYVSFLQALGTHLHGSTNGKKVVALRQNWNAIGTEHLSVPVAYQTAGAPKWVVPSGVSAGPDWTSARQTAFENTILDAHIDSFRVSGVMKPPVFIRTSLESAVLNAQATGQPAGYTYADYFTDGVLGWFTTGAEMEPRSNGNAASYEAFQQWCASGKTLGLAEPWADAWGNHAGITDVHWATPPQFNYWRVLSDLALGISYELAYGNDLDVASSGTYNGQSVGSTYKDEFAAAFTFANRYAGYAALPGSAPGAWIAFRPQDASLSSYAVADYAQSMKLLNPSATIGLDARNDGTSVPLSMPLGVSSDAYMSIGPSNQRFGSWARKLPVGNQAKLQLASAFETHVNAQTSKTINVTYFDGASGTLTVKTAHKTFTIALTNKKKWLTQPLPMSADFARDSSGADIVLTASGAPITLHMVEVTF
jgi:hypothetical protein